VNSKFCIFHDRDHYAEHEREATKRFEEKVVESISGERPLECFGYYVPDFDLKERIFTKPVYFIEAAFYKEANFANVIFREQVHFERANFGKQVNFIAANFHKQAIFSGAGFSNTTFLGAKFIVEANFTYAKFNVVFFDYVEFTQAAIYSCVSR
jgi:uncharacterized protein YjbI with pentapeptide repeats